MWHFTLERGDASRSYAGERLSSETASLGDDDKVFYIVSKEFAPLSK